MPTMTPQELLEHLRALAEAEEAELDEMLTDLLVHTYPTRQIQNS